MSATYQEVLNELANIDHTALAQPSDSEKLALAVWMERRKPSITLAQREKYDHYYNSILLKIIKALFSDYIAGTLNHKTFTAAEIQGHVELCIDTIKDLTKHIKLLAAEIKHIKWFYAEIHTKSKDPVLEEARQSLVDLYGDLNNAVQHKKTLFYLKNLYATDEFRSVASDSMKKVQLMNEQINTHLTYYQQGLDTIGKHIIEAEIEKFITVIDQEIINYQTHKLDIKSLQMKPKKLYEECQAISTRFDEAFDTWKKESVKNNLENIIDQLTDSLSQIETDSTAEFSHHFYSFYAEVLVDALNKMKTAPDRAEEIQEPQINLRYFLEEVEKRLKREEQKNSNHSPVKNHP